MYFIWYTYNYISTSKLVVILTVISTYMCVQTTHISLFGSFLITYIVRNTKELRRGLEGKTNSKVRLYYM